MRSLLFLFILSAAMAGCTGVRPANLGVTDGKLAPCPETPNCVSSQSPDKEHAVDPLLSAGEPKNTMARLTRIVAAMPRARIVTKSDRYLYAEFTSRIFRFVDDAEFSLDEQARRIDVRSASRLGRSDLGVNRERIEAIREKWNARD